MTTSKKSKTTVNTDTGTVDRTPAPDRLNGPSGADNHDSERQAAVDAARESDTNVPADQASTVAPAPVNDPERAVYGNTRDIGYKAPTRAAKSPDDFVPTQPDRLFTPESKARWAEVPTQTIREEQRAIREAAAKAEK